MTPQSAFRAVRYAAGLVRALFTTVALIMLPSVVVYYLTNQSNVEKNMNAQQFVQRSPLKLLLIGDSYVGKSSLFMRYTDDVHHEGYISTVGVDFKKVDFNCDGNSIKLHVWDTSGQERYSSIRRAFYSGARGVFIMYDTTNKESFENAEAWLREIYRYAPEVTIMLVGTKSDLESECVVGVHSARVFAQRYGLLFVETSARNDHNVSEAFETMAGAILGYGTVGR